MISSNDIRNIRIGTVIQDTDDVDWSADFKTQSLRANPSWNPPQTVVRIDVPCHINRGKFQISVETQDGNLCTITEGACYYRLVP